MKLEQSLNLFKKELELLYLKMVMNYPINIVEEYKRQMQM